MPLMSTFVIFLIVDAILLIRAELNDNRKQIYLFKPIATLTVIAIAALSFLNPGIDPVYSGIILTGLCFSLAGDLALMFPENLKAFRVGLACFLLAHIIYTSAFFRIGNFVLTDIPPILILVVTGIGFFLLIRAGLDSMKIPVIAYIIIITLMVAGAIIVFGTEGIRFQLGIFILLGAVLFYISDLILAANRFWKPWRYNRISLAFYYSGQLLIALSANFIGLS